MPLVGGGGAGNIAGSNPSGTSSGLNYIGNHAYGFSGEQIAVSGSDATLFDFTTGSSYFVGTFQLPFDKTGLANGESVGYRIKINGEIVARCEQEYLTAASTSEFIMLPVDLLIPSYSHVQITTDTDQASDWTTTGILTGRVYTDA